MAKNNFLNNTRKTGMSNKTKSILVTIAMILLIFALLTGVSSMMNKKNELEGFELQRVTWNSGRLNSEDGSMMIDKNFMYSSAIKCDTTLHITREFGSHVSYTVFYYDELGHLLFKDEEPTIFNYTKEIDSITVEDGKVIDHARIVCEWTEDDNAELSFVERIKLANQIKVYVAVETVDEVIDTEVEDTTEE